MGEKEECLTYTTGAVEVRQTVMEKPGEPHQEKMDQGQTLETLLLARIALAGVAGTIALYFVVILLLVLRG